MGILGKLFGLFRKKDETSFSIKFDYFDPATAANRKFISLDLHEGQVISREIIDFPRETGIKLKPKIWIIEDPRLGNGNRRIITHIEVLMKEKERDLCKVWGESIYGNSLYLRQGSQVLAYYGDDNARGYITTVYTLKLTPDLDYIITKKGYIK